uniref:NIDO domain-containing protein n=1 Tax=Angiostrongylus cantonensis TaxID=6313 RepID=A0A0K0D2N1_ANGCA
LFVQAGIIVNDVSSSITLPGSGTQGIEQLTQLSNVGHPGIWLFRIDEPSIHPCPLVDQQPPYCQKKAPHNNRTHPSRTIQNSLGSRRPAIGPGLRTGNNPIVGIALEGPRTIVPQLEPAPAIRHSTIVTSSFMVPSTQMTVSPTPAKTTRPRPRYESTPHRPIVSLGEQDFEELEPDVFELTIPPFITAVPEMFTPKEKPKPLPDFTLEETSTTIKSSTVELTFPTFPTFKLSDVEEIPSTITHTNFRSEATSRKASSLPSITDESQAGQDILKMINELNTTSDLSSDLLPEFTDKDLILGKVITFLSINMTNCNEHAVFKTAN